MQVCVKYKSYNEEWTRVETMPYDPSSISQLMATYTKCYANCDISITQYGIQLAYAKWCKGHGHNIVVCIDPRRVTETLSAILGRMPQERLKQALDTEPNAQASLFVELPKPH